jgi:peptidoglycan hydrolase CwlO-like protein
VLPELVTTDSNGNLSLNKDGIMPYIVEAVKQQNGNIADTNKQLGDIGITLTSLGDDLAKLTKRVDEIEKANVQRDAKIKALEEELQKVKQSNSPATTTTTP